MYMIYGINILMHISKSIMIIICVWMTMFVCILINVLWSKYIILCIDMCM